MKPVAPPRPKLTRPLKFKAARADNPLVSALMDRVSRKIQRLGISQASLARRIGAKPQAVGQWLAGRKSAPCGEMVLVLQRLLTKWENSK